mgnify:CR=1 FL=1
MAILGTIVLCLTFLNLSITSADLTYLQDFSCPVGAATEADVLLSLVVVPLAKTLPFRRLTLLH